MRKRFPTRIILRSLGCGPLLLAGCLNRTATVPEGYRTTGNFPGDLHASALLVPPAVEPVPSRQMKVDGKAPPTRPPFELPPSLPGSSVLPVVPPRFPPNTPAAEREKAVLASYPEVTSIGAKSILPEGQRLTLADLQTLATQNSPVLRRATAEADSVYGVLIQAGLHPNPTVGYQADQIQPNLRIPAGAGFSGAGQQGGYINLLIKTASKLSLAQKVAGFDYINALVAVRRAEIDVASQVRAGYFTVLVAQQSIAVNRSVVDLLDEVYKLQLKQVAAGEAAGYEPLQLYAQAEQARNALTQSENNYRAAWTQLVAAIGRTDLPPTLLEGTADLPAPVLDYGAIQARLLEQHTDVLTARNGIAQAEVNLRLQKRVPVPDILTNQYHQYDNAAQTYQFGVQVGIQVPLYDRNQGNIHHAAGQVARANQALLATQNDLVARLAEAYGRYNSDRQIVERNRDKIIPNLSRAYRAIIRRYQVEPDKVSFNDIVVAQQNLVQALHAYLAALDGQWKAVVDVANLGQLDELFIGPPK